jgi:hypothetical protein
LSSDVRFVDPQHEIAGMDAHHNLYRYHWAIHSENKLLLPGFDVLETVASGKVAMVLGFFGQLAPAKPIEA